MRSGSEAVFGKHALFFVPQRLGQIDIIAVGVLKAEHLVPHGADLLEAGTADFLDIRGGVHTFSCEEKRFLQRHRTEIFQRLTLPDVFRIENFVGLCVVERLVAQRDDIGERLTAFAVVQPPDHLEAGVGDFANFLFGCTFVVPAGIIYRLHHNKSRKHAVIGMAAGTVLTTAAACLMNAFVLLPAYGKAFGMPIEAFIEMGAAVNHSVNSLLGFVALIIVPFNLFKYILISVIVFFIYKRIRVILKGD